jgi:PcrA/UvrD tudor domain
MRTRSESKGGFGFAGYGASRFDEMASFGSSYTNIPPPSGEGDRASRGRVGANRRGEFSRFDPRDECGANRRGLRRDALTIEGELVAKSTGTVSPFAIGDRVFHQKFGNGNVVAVDGNKLTIAFDKAGEKRVVDSFVERVCERSFAKKLIATRTHDALSATLDVRCRRIVPADARGSGIAGAGVIATPTAGATTRNGSKGTVVEWTTGEDRTAVG